MITITSRTRIAGTHYWPEAPPPVKFLRQPHRHVFTIDCEVEVERDNREVEFFLMARDVELSISQRYAESCLGLMLVEFQSCSCEQIAANVMEDMLHNGYAVRSVRVREDDESYATVTP